MLGKDTIEKIGVVFTSILLILTFLGLSIFWMFGLFRSECQSTGLRWNSDKQMCVQKESDKKNLNFQEPSIYVIEEGNGIPLIANVGDHIMDVYDLWGTPDWAQRDDFFDSPWMFYEYHSRGVSFTSNQYGIIESIWIHCDYGHPRPQYKTFNGRTTKGLILHDLLTVEEVFEAYGKPERSYNTMKGDHNRPFNRDTPYFHIQNDSDYFIIYPEQEIDFEVHDGMVQAINIKAR